MSATGSGSVRCFVAVAAGVEIREGIEAAMPDLRRAAASAGWRVTWTRPEGWHATLKFLGDVATERLGEVAGRVREAAGSAGRFELVAEGVVVMPPSGEPRVLAAGLRDDGHLAGLAARIDEALAPLGFARETRAYTPHLTLGRVRRASRFARRDGAKVSASAMTTCLDLLRGRRFGVQEVAGFELLRSELGPTGSRYTGLASFELAATAGP